MIQSHTSLPPRLVGQTFTVQSYVNQIKQLLQNANEFSSLLNIELHDIFLA